MRYTAGIFIIDSTNRLLICRATGSDNWSIPKGHIDGNETVINAALRETLEETGMDLTPFKSNMVKLDLEVYKTGKKALYSFLLKIDTNIHVDKLWCDSIIDKDTRPEIDKYVMVDIKKAIDIVHEAQSKIIKKMINKGILK